MLRNFSTKTKLILFLLSKGGGAVPWSFQSVFWIFIWYRYKTRTLTCNASTNPPPIVNYLCINMEIFLGLQNAYLFWKKRNKNNATTHLQSIVSILLYLSKTLFPFTIDVSFVLLFLFLLCDDGCFPNIFYLNRKRDFRISRCIHLDDHYNIAFLNAMRRFVCVFFFNKKSGCSIDCYRLCFRPLCFCCVVSLHTMYDRNLHGLVFGNWHVTLALLSIRVDSLTFGPILYHSVWVCYELIYMDRSKFLIARERSSIPPLKRIRLYVAVKYTGPLVNLCPFTGGRVQKF